MYAFASELLVERKVSDATFRRAQEAFGTRGLVDLVGILGYYGRISMTIVAFDVAIPDGADPFGT